MTRRVLARLVAAVSLATTTSSAMATPATVSKPVVAAPGVSTVDVVGDDERDVYIGTGGLLLPGSFSGTSTTRHRVAECMGCTWRYTVYCSYDSEEMCAHAVVTCPLGKVRYRVWFGRSPESIAVIGSVCWSDGRPLTRREVDRHIAQAGERSLPALRPGYDPPGGTVTGLPVIVWSGQPRVVRPPQMTLSGMRVQLTCTARWRWEWGDGAAQWTGLPGGRYPSRDVTHAYRVSGRYRVTVTSVWAATYSVAGLGPFPVEGDVVRQQAAQVIPVRSARVLLMPWNTD